MLELYHYAASLDEVVLFNVDLHYLAVIVSFKHQLHLHRLHRQNRLALLNHIAHLTVNLRHCTRHR